MKSKKIIWMGVVIVGVFSAIAAMLTGCGKQPDNGVLPPASQPRPFGEVTSVPLPEDAELTGLFITHQGMRGGSYYILQTTDAGTYMKISNRDPGDYEMTKDEDVAALPANAKYLGFADIVKDCEYASSVQLEDDAPLRALEAAITESGALAWDGYDESDPMEDVLDSGDSYRLYLELSDGSAVTMKGYNVCPAGFMPLLAKAAEIFEENSDYSRYLAKNLDDSPCVSLFARFQEGMRTEYRLELSNGRWVVVLNDPDGEILDAGTDIADYGDLPQELPFDRFLDIMKHHGAEDWNGFSGTGSGHYGGFTLRLTFEDGKKFEASGSAFPEGFEDFKTDFIDEMRRLYTEVKEEKRP